MFHSDPLLVILSGPTAVGKSSTAIELASRIGGEIISADSMQVYRGMDIGTAKITVSEMQGIPHHLIDVCDLSTLYNVVSFVRDAKKKIEEIHQRGKLPIIVGGTGFYIHGLLYGEPKGPPADLEIRKVLEQKWEQGKITELKKQLQKIDPEYFDSISSQDRRKILRGLEIYEVTNKPPSSFPGFRRDLEIQGYRCVSFFMHLDRSVLYQRINQRVDQMMEQGFIAEVETLLQRGLKQNVTASQAIGYRQVIDYLAGMYDSKEEMILEIQKLTRRYAKRQMTWFRSDSNFQWVEKTDILDKMMESIEEKLAVQAS